MTKPWAAVAQYGSAVVAGLALVWLQATVIIDPPALDISPASVPLPLARARASASSQITFPDGPDSIAPRSPLGASGISVDNRVLVQTAEHTSAIALPGSSRESPDASNNRAPGGGPAEATSDEMRRKTHVMPSAEKPYRKPNLARIVPSAAQMYSPPTPPVPIVKVEPEYAEQARQAMFQGAVLLRIVIDEQGLPSQVEVVRPLGLGLDEKAVEAVKQWRFRPSMVDGRPVRSVAHVEVNFKLM